MKLPDGYIVASKGIYEGQIAERMGYTHSVSVFNQKDRIVRGTGNSYEEALAQALEIMGKPVDN